jgi:putative ABC transport system substrate-binding protein
VQAFIAAGDAVFFTQRRQITELALRNRLPSIFPQREYAQAGRLMSYGENLSDFFRRAASFVDKIFKGAKPGDLPIEQPTRFNLVINRKTADALGVTIPPQLRGVSAVWSPLRLLSDEQRTQPKFGFWART